MSMFPIGGSLSECAGELKASRAEHTKATQAVAYSPAQARVHVQAASPLAAAGCGGRRLIAAEV